MQNSLLSFFCYGICGSNLYQGRKLQAASFTLQAKSQKAEAARRIQSEIFYSIKRQP
jgi:hypothetical protein